MHVTTTSSSVNRYASGETVCVTHVIRQQEFPSGFLFVCNCRDRLFCLLLTDFQSLFSGGDLVSQPSSTIVLSIMTADEGDECQGCMKERNVSSKQRERKSRQRHARRSLLCCDARDAVILCSCAAPQQQDSRPLNVCCACRSACLLPSRRHADTPVPLIDDWAAARRAAPRRPPA